MTARVPGTRKGGRIYVPLPAVPDDEDSDLKNAIAARNVAWIQGRCPNCGAEPNVVAHPALGLVSIHFLHDDGCLVTEQLLDPREP